MIARATPAARIPPSVVNGKVNRSKLPFTSIMKAIVVGGLILGSFATWALLMVFSGLCLRYTGDYFPLMALTGYERAFRLNEARA